MIHGNYVSQQETITLLQNRSVIGLIGPAHIGKTSFIIDHFKSYNDVFIADNSIDSIREAISFSTSLPLMDQYKILIIPHIELLSISAQDACLKLFEESCNHLKIVCTSFDLDHLTDALCSRIRNVVKFKALDEHQMASFAASFGPVNLKILKICGGIPGLYKHMFNNLVYDEFYELLNDIDKNLFNQVRIFSYYKEVKERIIIDSMLRLIDHFLIKYEPKFIPLLEFASVLSSNASLNIEAHWMKCIAKMVSECNV